MKQPITIVLEEETLATLREKKEVVGVPVSVQVQKSLDKTME